LGISGDSRPEQPRCLLAPRLRFQDLKRLLQICDGLLQFVIGPITCFGDEQRRRIVFGRGRDVAQPKIVRRSGMPSQSKT
jgi:hypothetical protein